MTPEWFAVNELVDALPEIYQPIFNHPEFSVASSRECTDRLKDIDNAYKAIEKMLKRPLKVLDLGCAQGFFSLSLAQMGAIVIGVDYSQPNISICNYLASENPHLKVEFRLDSVDRVINTLRENDFDFVIGMSIFHHLIYEYGLAYVESLLSELAHKAAVGIYEFALDSEPLYWASRQPSDPRNLLNEYTFKHELSRHGTHLSTVNRPLFFASNDFWLLGAVAGSIDLCLEIPHDFDRRYHNNTRRYFFSGDKLVKVFCTDSRECGQNKMEIAREVAFLRSPPKCFAAPAILGDGQGESESWIVRQLIEGELFTNCISSGRAYKPALIIESVLHQLVCLEENGLYHGDVRPWNVLVLPDGSATLIDYGAISEFIEDGQDVYGQILSFFVLAREVVTGKIRNITTERPSFVSSTDFKGKFRAWTNAMWAIPAHEWSFQSVLAHFINANSERNAGDENDRDILESLPGVIEGHLTALSRKLDWNLQTFKQNEDRALQVEIRATQAEALATAIEARATEAEARATQAEALATAIEARATEAEARAVMVEANMAELLNSTSWKIMAPIRALGRFMRRQKEKRK